MNTANSRKYYSGTIQSYDAVAGYGYIQPDESEEIEGEILVHYKSFRDNMFVPKIGQRVIFLTGSVPTGIVAKDVYLEEIDTTKDPSTSESVIGEIVQISPNRDYGFVKIADGREAFYHITYVSDEYFVPYIGARVSCNLVLTSKGLQAQNLSIVADSSDSDFRADNILAQAVLARDQKRYDEAVKLYDLGLKNKPSLPLILSYAAMEKNRGNKTKAMNIYEQGIKVLPRSAKLREDAGILAASLHKYDKAITLLRDSLDLCRQDPGQRGKKGVLLSLARTYYAMNTLRDLENAVDYYEQAVKAFESEQRFPSFDSLAFNIAKIRTQHHRGNLAIQFFQKNSFQVVRAKLFVQDTVGADLIIRITNMEFIESYGLGEQILVRCLFKSDVLHSDIEDLDKTISNLSSTGQVDEQVAFLVVSSLPENLQRTLFKRIEELRGKSLAIIPITQQDIETGTYDLSILRGILDKWLYRRDLFAANFPVVGSRFFGREKPLAELRDAISSGTPMGIFGLRKVGKTSLLKEVERRSSEFGDIVGYIDLLRVPSDVTDVKWLYWRIAQVLREKTHLPGIEIKWRLGGKHDSYLDVPEGFPLATAFDADLSGLLAAIRKTIISPKPKVVILLDEIERLLPNRLGKEGFKGIFDFFGYLRGVSQESNNLVVIVTGANASISESAQFENRDNPVFNFFKETYLQLLELNETRLMLQELGKGMGIKFSQEAMEYLYYLTGGHPFFTRQLCSFMAGIYNDRPLQIHKRLIERVLDQYIEYSSKDYQEIVERLTRDYPAERDACILLARSGGKLPLKQFVQNIGKDKASIKHLLGYQIVRVENDQVAISMELLRRWLAKE